MTYWLCITTKDNWEISEKTKTLGFKERIKTLSDDIKIGDIGFIYIKTEASVPNPLIIAKFKITSPMYRDDSELFKKLDEYPKELFPQRVKIEILTKLDNPLIFKSMINDLTFIKNKQAWGSALFGRSLINLSNYDYQIIDSKFK